MTLITPLAQNLIDRTLYLRQKDFARQGVFLVDVVDFGREAHLLAGPWEDKYGVVELWHHPQALPLEVQCKKAKDRAWSSLTYAPREICKHVQAIYPEHLQGTDFWWNASTQTSLSGFDVEWGASTDGYELTGTKYALFFNSAQGRSAIASILTAEQMKQWQTEIEQHLQWNKEEMERECATQEKPYTFFLYGNDDMSWKRTFATKKSCVDFWQQVREKGFQPLHPRPSPFSPKPSF